MTADRSQARAGAIAALANSEEGDPEWAEWLLDYLDAHPEAKAALAAWLVPDLEVLRDGYDGRLASQKAAQRFLDYHATQPATKVPAGEPDQDFGLLAPPEGRP